MVTLLAIILLGFFLGMRHATDPDHVIAVTTIVSRERTMLHAVIIGALWGLGHTVTILTVGSAIILLKLTIPPKLGLSMELSVAFMLILLGALNLTGLMRRAIEWFTTRCHGPGAHAHVVLGRVIVHTHDAWGEPNGLGKVPLFGWAPQWWKQLGLFHIPAPAGSRNCSWPRRFRRSSPVGADNNQAAGMGHRLPAWFLGLEPSPA